MDFIKEGFKYILIETLKYILITFALYGVFNLVSDRKIVLEDLGAQLDQTVKEAKTVTPEMLEQHVRDSIAKGL